MDDSAVAAKAPPRTGSWMRLAPNWMAWLPGVGDVVAELVLFLVTYCGEESDGGGELVVAVGLEAGDGEGGGAEGEGECEAEVRVAGLGEMQAAGVEHEIAEPGGGEGEGLLTTSCQ